jgi:hypothetical protein
LHGARSQPHKQFSKLIRSNHNIIFQHQHQHQQHQQTTTSATCKGSIEHSHNEIQSHSQAACRADKMVPIEPDLAPFDYAAKLLLCGSIWRFVGAGLTMMPTLPPMHNKVSER